MPLTTGTVVIILMPIISKASVQEQVKEENQPSGNWLTLVYVCSMMVIESDKSIDVKYCQTTTVLRPFVRDYPGEPVPEETLTLLL